jgi:sec-independent protein translocase protein TatC
MFEDFINGTAEHIEELRRRLLFSAIAILAATAVAFVFSDQILRLLLLPSGGLQLKAFSVMDGFMIKWRLALYSGVVVAFPVWAYHIYAFVSPGLYAHERKAIFPPLVGSLFLFEHGAVFGYYLLWGMIRVLIELFPQQVEFLPAADDYISFVIFFLLSCGLAFQLPTLLIILAQLHLISSQLLRKQRKIAYFSLFVFAELITPVADPIVAPLTVMVPLLLLYEVSIWVIVRIEAGRKRAEIKAAGAG